MTYVFRFNVCGVEMFDRLSAQDKKWMLTLGRFIILAQNATKERICRQFGIDPNSVKLD
ncbi:hypothetical protein FACS1894172_09220 [Spirochaetia bacterium]|nr:hypothetical protein FACS1894172_09220 [Spirochaetia bacterium]